MNNSLAKDQLLIWSEGLSKVYRGKKKKNDLRAVNRINLRVEPGIHGFLGPNGAGKTTTINMLIGGLSISEGEATIKGHKAGTVAAKQLIGFLPQDPQFYDTMTGEDYLIYVGKLGGLNAVEGKKQAQELMRYFDIWDARERIIKEYSGGMRQKIGIAAALIHSPEILILDEPTANLDPIGRQHIIDRIKELSGKMSVFVSSHILSEIEQMCKDVTMINHGEIIISDTLRNIKTKFIGDVFILHTNKNDLLLKDLQKDPNIMKVFLEKIQDSDDEAPVLKMVPVNPEILQKKIPRLLLDNDAILYSFKRPEVSLQDIFMQLMVKKPTQKQEGNA